MHLFRPVGLEELRLIYESGMVAFPPRLPEQPIFYPVLNRGYAQKIASSWNVREGSKAGFVTHFQVADDYCERFTRQVVGSRARAAVLLSGLCDGVASHGQGSVDFPVANVTTSQ